MKKKYWIIGGCSIAALLLVALLGYGVYAMMTPSEQPQPAVVPEATSANNAVTGGSNSSETGKQIVLVSREDIEQVTGMSISIENAGSIASKFQDSGMWVKLGFTEDESERIAARAQQSSEQLRGILKSLTHNNHLQLKIILLPDGHVNLGKGNSYADYNGNGASTDGYAGINQLEIEVEYINGDYQLEYKNNGYGIDGEIEDERTGSKLKGSSAVAEIEAQLDLISLSPDMSSEAIFAELDKAFPVASGWQKYEVEIHFSDGTVFEYRR
ncbi:YusW family protein [Culicoidibacter larvae]|uniref:Uncharacterized protein n=1 Tax=Culicoidibacter larvae TaxID=2579976 RepID=A0A5R8Q8A9_9FIRM|nr:YusW family protein [Culicoidibacter larvae]TLG71814.1 hypothetical protein FEZ08_10425 [Culicoidibacter larvae]